MLRVHFVDPKTSFVVRQLEEPDKLGRTVIQVVDIRITGEVVEQRAYFLRHNGKRWSQNKDLFALEGKYPGVVQLIRGFVFGRPNGAPRAENIVYFHEWVRQHAPTETPPPSPPSETMPAPRRKRAACG